MVKPPYTLYKSQEKYIQDVKNFLFNDTIPDAVKSELDSATKEERYTKYLLQEGPTGMGKTVVNLMGALYWIKHMGGRVVYFSREHAQIQQCMQDLRRLEKENPDIIIRAVHIAGRSTSCLIEEVKTTKDQDEQLLMCEEYHGALCNYSNMLQQQNGGQISTGEILSLLPQHQKMYYNFDIAFGSSILDTWDADTHTQMVQIRDIVDELFDDSIATNEIIMKVAKKYTVCPRKLETLAVERANLIFAPYNYMVIPRIKMTDQEGNPNADWYFVVDEAHNLDSNLTQMVSYEISKSRITEFVSASDKVPYRNEREFINSRDHVLSVIITRLLANEKAYTGQELYDILKSMNKHVVEEFLSYTSMYVRRSIRQRVFNTQTNSNVNTVPRSFLSMNKLLEAIQELMYARNSGIITVKDGVLVIQFVNTAQIFSRVTRVPNKVAITSGSLYPEFMRKYLGIERNSVVYEYTPPHNNLTNVGQIISHYNANVLGTRYAIRSRATFDALANAICDIHEQSESGGTLVFFPSYQFVDAIATKIVQRRHKNKVYLPQNVDDFRKEIANGNKAIFTTAFRGLGSEGWNFPDEQCRVIIMCGIPHLPYKDPIVQAQKEYYEQMRPNLGQTWYKQKAILWMVQAFGRGLRHKDDYVKVYFLDEKVYREKRMFTKWVRDAINWRPIKMTGDDIHRH